MVIPVPIVSVLFERGAFGPDDTVATALALAVYGAGLPAFVLQKVLQPLYFAREDTRTPFRYALVAMVVNAVAAIGFAMLLGVHRRGHRHDARGLGDGVAPPARPPLDGRGRDLRRPVQDAGSGASWRPPS
jgi:hypothetical protein